MADNPKGKAAAAGGALMLALGLIAYFEGTVDHTYIDPAGIPTICTGHTGPDVKVGQFATDEMCRDLLAKDTAWAFDALARNVDHPEKLEPWTRAAMASFIYNLGESAFKSSPIPGLLNLGRVTDACNAMLPYNMARVNGKLTAFAGLIHRREAERNLCLGEPWN